MVNNVLLVFPYQVKDESDFNKIIEEFDKNGYQIHFFEGFNGENFNIEALPMIISELTKTPDTKIVVISNIAEIILLWYRCYNSLADDFIYYIDGPYTPFFASKQYDRLLIDLLVNFSNIEAEKIEGKIYVNLCHQNYQLLYSFLVFNNHFRYFDSLTNLNYHKCYFKKIVNKAYQLNQQLFQFGLGVAETSTVVLKSIENPTLVFDEEFTNYLNQNIYFVKYFVIEMSKHLKTQGDSFIFNYFRSLQNVPQDIKEKIHHDLLEHIRRPEVKFPEKVYILSLLEQLKVKGTPLLNIIMNALEQDREYIHCHYLILQDTSFYISHDGIELYDNYVIDRKNELRRIAASFGFKQLFHSSGVDEPKKIAILVDQLKVLTHSPTRLILDYANNLFDIGSDFKIKIFIEDNMIHCPQELLMPGCFTSESSSMFCVEHQKYLKGRNIEIYYSQAAKSRKERTLDIVQAIIKFNPSVILTTSDLSLARIFLYPEFPVIYMSMGWFNYSTLADVHLVPRKEEALNDNQRYQLIEPEKIFEFHYGLSLFEPKKKHSRMDYKLNENDFIMVTVGNRLDVEISSPYMDLICQFLKDNANARWVIIGPAKLTYLEETYQQLAMSQIIRIPFEDDLPGFYKICDVYLNPFRHGGGMSITMAMNQELPVVISEEPSDGLLYVGSENSAGLSFEDYINELNHLYQDIIYRRNKGALMKERIKLFDMKNSSKELIEHFEIARGSFQERKILNK